MTSNNDKYISTSDIIGIANLALRWSYRSVFNIPLHIYTGTLNVYQWQEELQAPDGRKINRISLVNASNFTQDLASMMPNIVFCLQDVESIEKIHNHYTATRQLKEHQNKILVATGDNIHEVINAILFVCSRMETHESYVVDEQVANYLILDGVLKFIMQTPAHSVEINNIFPFFSNDDEKSKPLTTFDLAQEFVKLCAPQNRCDELLALLEVDKRFPGLTQDQIAALFPPPSRTENPESLVKHVYRLRSAAYKYQKIIFDHPVH